MTTSADAKLELERLHCHYAFDLAGPELVIYAKRRGEILREPFASLVAAAPRERLLTSPTATLPAIHGVLDALRAQDVDVVAIFEALFDARVVRRAIASWRVLRPILLLRLPDDANALEQWALAEMIRSFHARDVYAFTPDQLREAGADLATHFSSAT
jgi:hypothetical protein